MFLFVIITTVLQLTDHTCVLFNFFSFLLLFFLFFSCHLSRSGEPLDQDFVPCWGIL